MDKHGHMDVRMTEGKTICPSPLRSLGIKIFGVAGYLQSTTVNSLKTLNWLFTVNCKWPKKHGIGYLQSTVNSQKT